MYMSLAENIEVDSAAAGAVVLRDVFYRDALKADSGYGWA